MYYPHSIKVTVTDGKTGKKTTETRYGVRNSLDRDKFLKSFGEAKFNKLVQTDSHYKKYREPPIPLGCKWIWNKFNEIYFECNRDFNGNVQMTYRDITDYEQCMGIHFSIVEKRLLLKMKHWTQEVVSDLSK